MRYEIPEPLAIPGKGDPRYTELSLSEIRKQERLGWERGRCIGGDCGDLIFDGYDIGINETTLYRPLLITDLVLRTPEEVQNIAERILFECYDSIGVACLT